MRITDQSREIENTDATEEISWDNSQSLVSHRSYHEMSDRPVQEMNELSQLKFQMRLLTELHGRQAFLMREIRFLMKI